MLPSWLKPCLDLAVLGRGSARLGWAGFAYRAWQAELSTPAMAEAPLIAGLDALLAAAPSPIQPGSRLRLIVPDHVARYQLLPWTPALSDPAELRQFAIERFELASIPVQTGWSVQAEWRGEGAAALVYALPHALLAALGQWAEERDFPLDHVMPASAHLHYHRLAWRRRDAWVLLNDGVSINALTYQAGRLAHYASERVRGTPEHTLQRLLSRLQISQPLPTRVEVLGLDPARIKLTDVAEAAPLITTTAPFATLA